MPQNPSATEHDALLGEELTVQPQEIAIDLIAQESTYQKLTKLLSGVRDAQYRRKRNIYIKEGVAAVGVSAAAITDTVLIKKSVVDVKKEKHRRQHQAYQNRYNAFDELANQISNTEYGSEKLPDTEDTCHDRAPLDRNDDQSLCEITATPNSIYECINDPELYTNGSYCNQEVAYRFDTMDNFFHCNSHLPDVIAQPYDCNAHYTYGDYNHDNPIILTFIILITLLGLVSSIPIGLDWYKKLRHKTDLDEARIDSLSNEDRKRLTLLSNQYDDLHGILSDETYKLDDLAAKLSEHIKPIDCCYTFILCMKHNVNVIAMDNIKYILYRADYLRFDPFKPKKSDSTVEETEESEFAFSNK